MLGREAKGIDFDGSGHPAFVRHADPKTNEDEQRVPATQVFANCAPHALARMLRDAERAKIEHAYGPASAANAAASSATITRFRIP
jgi:hypothetical protein